MGIVPLAYMVFALALGVAAGAIIRHSIPAMIVTLIGYLGAADSGSSGQTTCRRFQRPGTRIALLLQNAPWPGATITRRRVLDPFLATWEQGLGPFSRAMWTVQDIFRRVTFGAPAFSSTHHQERRPLRTSL